MTQYTRNISSTNPALFIWTPFQNDTIIFFDMVAIKINFKSISIVVIAKVLETVMKVQLLAHLDSRKTCCVELRMILRGII